MRATLADGGGNVPRIPPWRLAGKLAWESARVQTEVTLRHAGRQGDPNAAAFNKDEVLAPGRDLRLVLRARF